MGEQAVHVCAVFAALVPAPAAGAAWIWIEGEEPTKSTMHPHPYWYDLVKHDQLSGGRLISNFHEQPGEVSYRFNAPAAGAYEFWVRANPVQAKFSYQLNDCPWTPIDVAGGQASVRIPADGKFDLRFVASTRAGKVALKKQANTITFRMDSQNNNHGYLDCLVFTDEPFAPRGAQKPDQLAADSRKAAAANAGWFAFDPRPDTFASSRVIPDLTVSV
jgi:hypothetical protein